MLTAILEVSAQYQVSVLNATKDAVSMRCVGYPQKFDGIFHAEPSDLEGVVSILKQTKRCGSRYLLT